MQHICFFVGNIGHSGGTERVTTALVNALVQQGYQLSILSLQAGKKSFFPLNQSIQLSQLAIDRKYLAKPIYYFWVIFRLRRFLKRARINILIDVETMLALYSTPALIGLKVKHITWEHFNFQFDLGKKLRRWARHLAAAYSNIVVTLTERDRSQWLAAIRWRRAKLVSIPNPIPFEIPAPIDEATRAPLVLAVGRLTPQKGFDWLLQAWQQVIAQAPQWRLRIVGDGEQRAELEQLRATLGLQASVELLPTTTDIEQHYREASLFCLSSRFEGFPMVLLEAQAFGLPCVSFDCPCGPSDIIEEGVAGLLAPVGDIQALTQQLLRLINDPERRKQMGKSARLRMQGQFSIQHILPQWEKLF